MSIGVCEEKALCEVISGEREMWWGRENSRSYNI